MIVNTLLATIYSSSNVLYITVSGLCKQIYLEYKKDKSITPAEQVISGVPDVLSWPLTKDDKFLVMGCDGVWELLNADDICRIVNNKVDDCDDLTLLANEILDKGMAPSLGTGEGCDNMSCIVIKLNY